MIDVIFSLVFYSLFSLLTFFPLISFFASGIIGLFKLYNLSFYDGGVVLKSIIAISFLPGFVILLLKYNLI